MSPAVLNTPIKQVKRARSLRWQMSLPEVQLWQVLRQRPDGLKFRRQFPINGITVDFACLERRLIIEVDGDWHSQGDQPQRDASRDAQLRKAGFEVMRITARDVLGNLEGAIGGILACCADAGPLHHPADGPPPRSGEDLR